MFLEDCHDGNVCPVSYDTCDQAANGVRQDGFRRELAEAERVEHGGMGAEEAALAHTHGGTNGNGVVVNQTFSGEAGYQTQGCAYRTQ